MTQDGESEIRERMARLWGQADGTVQAFVFSAISGFQAAEDVVQEVALSVARRFGQYDPARPFVAWAGWMSVNGQAIFATRPWKVYGEGAGCADNGTGLVEKKPKPFKPQDIRFTQSKDGSVIHATVLSVPTAPVRIKSLAGAKIGGVTPLGYSGKLEWKQDPDALAIQPVDVWPCQYAVAFKITTGE